jgi:N-acylneuraminate cytidylyltransferase
MDYRVVALIPARAGSKRVPGKNVRLLAGHPLMAYTIAAARHSGIFADVIVSTDAEAYAEIARRYGAEVPFLRPAEMAGELSPDIEWVEYTLQRLAAAGRHYDAFSILRPTSPFRQPETIRRAWQQFLAGQPADSLRAVEKCKQHPGKMWVIRNGRLLPLLPLGPAEQPWHSTPYQALPEIYVQNASLEIAWSRVVFITRTIAGTTIIPFLTEGYEGLDINDEKDWWYAEHLLVHGQARLPVMA